MKIILDDSEMFWAAQIGCRRNIASLSRGDRPTYNKDYMSTWSTNIIGAQGELAFSKAFGIDWESSVDSFNSLDALGFIEIKTTPVKSPHFILQKHKSVRDHDLGILVHADWNVFSILAITRLTYVQFSEYDRGDSWWMPVSHMRRFDTMIFQWLKERIIYDSYQLHSSAPAYGSTSNR